MRLRDRFPVNGTVPQESPSLQVTEPAALPAAPDHARVARGLEMGTSLAVDRDHPVGSDPGKDGEPWAKEHLPSLRAASQTSAGAGGRSQDTARSASLRAFPWSDTRSLGKPATDLGFCLFVDQFWVFLHREHRCALPAPRRGGRWSSHCPGEGSAAAGTSSCPGPSDSACER